MMILEVLKIFAVVLVAELGDKTQLAVLAFAASGKPLATFIGASLALIAITAVGAGIGGAFGRFIPQKTIQIAAGVLFIVLGALYIWRGVRC